jgi:hypothetical protein
MSYGKWSRASRVCNLGTMWCVASFTYRSLYPWGKTPHSPLDKMLDGPYNVDVVARGKSLAAQPAATHFTELQEGKHGVT